MSGRSTSAEKLERLLYLLPAAAEGEGATLAELSENLGVDEERVLRDVQEVTARAYHGRPGMADRLQIAVEGDRIRVWTAGEFARPVKLSPREALAVDLALRGLAMGIGNGTGADVPDDRLKRRQEIARRLEADLAVASVEELAEHFAVEEETREGRDARVQSGLFRAAREGRWCRIRYLGSGDTEPEWRTVAPYALVYDDGRWYAVSRCRTAGGLRIFRFDRVLDLEVEEERFEVPEEFDLSEHLAGERAYDAPADEVEVTVRYDRRVARWIREQWDVEEVDGGDVVVRHPVADPRWIVRHVLQYGGAAEVVDPPGIRERVAEAARRVLEESPAEAG